MKKAEIRAILLDYMGSDLTVVNAARASFDKESAFIISPSGPPYPGARVQTRCGGPESYLTEADAKLIRFLARGYRTNEWSELLGHLRSSVDDAEHLERLLLRYKSRAQHWAPFAHPQVQLRVSMPIFLARQMAKHQVGGTWSEVSRRYVEGDRRYWFPREWHVRPADVKQGTGAPVDDQESVSVLAERATMRADVTYETLRAAGVAPEEARIVLPQNLMTTVIWTGSLLFWSRVCIQRTDSHAQLAAQELGRKISSLLEPIFPVSWAELVAL